MYLVPDFISERKSLLSLGLRAEHGAMQHRDLTSSILRAAFKVHSQLGPGLLESAYTACLEYELVRSGHTVFKEVMVEIAYDDLLIPAYRMDLLVDSKVMIEVKSVKELNDLHLAQAITYVKLGKADLGLLINFNERNLRTGIRRIHRGSAYAKADVPAMDPITIYGEAEEPDEEPPVVFH